MKLTDANVYLIEHKLVRDICAGCFDVTDTQADRDTLLYVCGVNDMAQAVVEALREVKNV
jgi:NAD(P)H-flavin reductase